MDTLTLFLATVLVVGATASPFSDPIVPYNYHQRIGFQLAADIKKAEEDIENTRHGGQKIINGPYTDISEVPYQALLVITTLRNPSACGGSLISETRVLTAAHCHSDGVTVPLFHTVVLGSNFLFSGGLRINTVDVVIHPEYHFMSFANDIAVMRIRRVSFTNLIQPIALPSAGEDYVRYSALVSGIGLTSDTATLTQEQALRSLSVTIVSNEECFAVYGNIIQDSSICTEGVVGRGPCSSDSGGPLAIKQNNQSVLIGVLSFVTRPCSGGFPAGFARVSYYLPWIFSLL